MTRIYAVRTTVGQERTVADILAARAMRTGKIKSILILRRHRGYIYVEADRPDVVIELIRGIRHAKARAPLLVSKEELEKILMEKIEVRRIAPGDIVEAIEGPLKGSLARVVDVDYDEGMASLSLLDTPASISITYPLSQLRLVKEKEEAEKGESGAEEVR